MLWSIFITYIITHHGLGGFSGLINGLIAAAIGALSMLMSEPTAKSYVNRTRMFVLSINRDITYLQDLIKVKPPCRYQLRSDDKFFLAVPKTKCKTFGDRAFYKAGPDLWNHLPLSLRNTNDLQKFKKDLKTHLFRVAFSEH